jgi:ABC-type branched-subunit amino acid transport system ATPase component
MKLEATGISVKFAGLTALKDVSLSAEQGEVLGLIGPNGSGKTTLLNAISGVLKPSSGRVRLDGESWQATTLQRSARLGVRRTFQNIRLFDEMTVLETVEVPVTALGKRGHRREQAMRVLAEVGLAPHRDRIADTLPYGMQRRVEIARAIAGGTRFLLLDEPTAGLNRAESDEVVKTILAIRDRHGCGVVLVDHDLRVITTACSRIVVLNEGEVISEGDPEKVRNDPAVIKAYLG